MVQIAYSDQYNDTTRSSYLVEIPYRHPGRKEDSKNIYGKAATSTLNALYLPLWSHLCEVDLWTMFPGRLSFRKAEEENWWDSYSSGGLDDEQV